MGDEQANWHEYKSNYEASIGADDVSNQNLEMEMLKQTDFPMPQNENFAL